LLPHRIGEPLVGPVVTGLLGAPEPVAVHLVVWPGFNFALLLGLVAIAAGLTLYAARAQVMRLSGPLARLEAWGPGAWYDLALVSLIAIGEAQTRWLQSGYLRNYLLIVLITALGLIGTATLRLDPLPIALDWRAADMLRWSYEHLYLLLT